MLTGCGVDVLGTDCRKEYVCSGGREILNDVANKEINLFILKKEKMEDK